jgi:hypothetical protein
MVACGKLWGFGRLWLSGCLAVLPGTLPAQGGFCDANLRPSAANTTYGYQARGDRCEGVYEREVAGTTLLVASFTRGFEEFAAPPTASLNVTWTSPSASPVRVRAYSLRRQLYYQMDTAKAPGPGLYTWPTDVLAGLGIGKTDLGVVVRTSMPLEGADRDVYLPAIVGSRPLTAGKYDLVLLSDQELSEVFITLSILGLDGRPVRVLRKNAPLNYGFYPAQRAIHLGLPEVAEKGMYLLAAGATIRSGGSYTLRCWFYHDGK